MAAVVGTVRARGRPVSARPRRRVGTAACRRARVMARLECSGNGRSVETKASAARTARAAAARQAPRSAARIVAGRVSAADKAARVRPHARAATAACSGGLATRPPASWAIGARARARASAARAKRGRVARRARRLAAQRVVGTARVPAKCALSQQRASAATVVVRPARAIPTPVALTGRRARVRASVRLARLRIAGRPACSDVERIAVGRTGARCRIVRRRDRPPSHAGIAARAPRRVTLRAASGGSRPAARTSDPAWRVMHVAAVQATQAGKSAVTAASGRSV